MSTHAEPMISRSPLTLAEAARIMREAMRDKGYELTPLGEEIKSYLIAKRKRLTKESYGDYEGTLAQLAKRFPDLHIDDLEPPIGTQHVEEFLDDQWGQSAPATYNRNLSIVKDFFRFECLRERLHGDPTLAIERARKRDVYRTIFTPDQTRAIIAEQDSRRDRLVLRLMLSYGLRKGAIRAIQFKHFDHQRRRLTIFTKGAKVRELPIPDPAWWRELEHHILDVEAQPHHYLLCTRAPGRHGNADRPHLPMSQKAAHAWWYRCLEHAGLVPMGAQSGERMHKARHTAGQRVLDSTGNLKAVQTLLGHASIQTTGDVYTDWDLEQLAATLGKVLAEEAEGS